MKLQYFGLVLSLVVVQASADSSTLDAAIGGALGGAAGAAIGNELGGRDGAIVTIVGICDIDDLIDIGGSPVRLIENGL